VNAVGFELSHRTRRVSKRWALPLAIVLAVCGYMSAVDSQVSAASVKEGSAMSSKIQISINGAEITGSLNDSPAARDFAALVPLTLTLQDYNGTEKISDPRRRLSGEGSPEGFKPAAGDIAFYAPWGSLAVFYHGFRYSPAWCRWAISTPAWRPSVGPGP
jgi:hypothetical protein